MNAELINKYIAGDALPSEKEEVMEWIGESDENRQQFTDMRRIYDVSIWHKSTSSVSNGQSRRKPLMLQLWRLTKIAAVVALIAMVSVNEVRDYFKSHSQNMQTITVPEGQRVQLLLADGTKVWMNSNSSLQFPEYGFSSDERAVILNGEAYFEVKRDENHPFIVKTQEYTIQVLGTTFNVSAYANSGIFETALISGKVQVNDIRQEEEIILLPNERVFLENGRMRKSRFSSDDSFLWKDGIYSFDDETFDVIFKKLERYYEIRIVNENKQLALRRCTAKFRQKEGIEQVIKVLQKRVGFSYMRNEEENTITIK